MPLKVVAIGGGTGLAALLRALKPEAGRARDPWRLTGIVTVSDDGGSSGRLRDELGGIPPGDLRNCLSALTREESVLSDLLNYRFQGEGSLSGHSLGNLMLHALADLTGDWVHAIRQLSNVLVTVGRLYPSTVVPVVLRAEDMDGVRYTGETHVNNAHPPLARFWAEPLDAEPLPEAILAVLQADLILLAPGSLYTSTIATLLITELREAVSRTGVPVLYVANLMTEPGESSGMNLEAHLAAIQSFAHLALTAVLANTAPLPGNLKRRYQNEGGEPVVPTATRLCGVPVFSYPLLDPEAEMVRHHPALLNRALRDVIATL
jgi:uncharacterized cofD-like protein